MLRCKKFSHYGELHFMIRHELHKLLNLLEKKFSLI